MVIDGGPTVEVGLVFVWRFIFQREPLEGVGGRGRVRRRGSRVLFEPIKESSKPRDGETVNSRQRLDDDNLSSTQSTDTYTGQPTETTTDVTMRTLERVIVHQWDSSDHG